MILDEPNVIIRVLRVGQSRREDRSRSGRGRGGERENTLKMLPAGLKMEGGGMSHWMEWPLGAGKATETCSPEVLSQGRKNVTQPAP